MTWNDLVHLAEAQSISVRPIGGGLLSIFGDVPAMSANPADRTILIEACLLAQMEGSTQTLNARMIGAFMHEIGHVVDFHERKLDASMMQVLYQKAQRRQHLTNDEQSTILTAELSAWQYARTQATALGYRIPRWFVAICLGSYLETFIVTGKGPESTRAGIHKALRVVADAWRLSRA